MVCDTRSLSPIYTNATAINTGLSIGSLDYIYLDGGRLVISVDGAQSNCQSHLRLGWRGFLLRS